jgi:site-specific DNA-methyltransferase (adenine-specific)
MRGLPDKAFNLAIVDVPYTDNYDSMKQISVSNKGKAGDYHYNSLSNAKPTKEYWDELKRVSKNQIVWGANYLIEYLNSTPCVIVWDKNNSGNFADCEIAFATFTTGAKIFKYTWNGMIQQNMKDKEERIHPTQKPVALYRWLLRNYAKPNDTIFDSHMGSQSSRIACHMEGFDFTGCELDAEYFEQGNQRYEAFLKTYGTPDPTQAIKGQQINLF